MCPVLQPGYPGGIFAPFVPGDIEELKLKELKNARLSMLAFVGFTMQAQVLFSSQLLCYFHGIVICGLRHNVR